MQTILTSNGPRHLGAMTWLLSALCLLLALIARPADAHQAGQSYLYLQVYQDSITGRFEIPLTALNPALGLSGTDRRITRRNLDEHIDFLQDYYRERVTLSADGVELPYTFGEHRFLGTKHRFVVMDIDIHGYDTVPESITFDYNILFDEDPTHRGFVLIETNWATGTFANENGISLVFSPDSRQDTLDLTTEGIWRGFLAVVWLGTDHIWEGIDHILFLIALLLPAVMRREDGKWVPIERFTPALVNVVKIVTAFTVAHSLTLSLAALGIIELPGRLVEVVIAASIAVAAADILFPLFRGRVWLVVLGFGLFHGFGFAGALSEMGVFGDHVWLPLLAFNLGVELGQIVIVAILFPILFLLRRLLLYPKLIMPVGAVFLIVMSLAWVAERGLEVEVPLLGKVESVMLRVLP